MPTITQIFGKNVKDRKPSTCQNITTTDEAPFIKRCTNAKAHNLSVCVTHAYTVNYLDGNGIERTAYFNSIAQAEYFKKTGVNWLECSYDPRRIDMVSGTS